MATFLRQLRCSPIEEDRTLTRQESDVYLQKTTNTGHSLAAQGVSRAKNDNGRKRTKSKLLRAAVAMWICTAAHVNAENCSEILNYVRDTTEITDSSYKVYNFSRFFCDQTFSSFQEANDAGAKVGISLAGLLDATFDGYDRTSNWSQYQHSLCEAIDNHGLEARNWRSKIEVANAAVVKAWETCLESPGLHFWAQANQDEPHQIGFFAKYISQGPPYQTLCRGPVTIQPEGQLSCMGDEFTENTSIDSASKSLNCIRNSDTALTIGLSTEQGAQLLTIPQIKSKPQVPLAPPLITSTFSATGEPAQHAQAEVEVPVGFKIISGGARVNWQEPGNLLTASYPETSRKWVAKSKDHVSPSPASITVWAMALYDPNDEWDVQIFPATSDSQAQHLEAASSVPEDFLLTGGGAQVLWQGEGNLLTASFPRDSRTWEARSKDHLLKSPAALFVYAIGVRPKNGAPLPHSQIFSDKGLIAAHPSTQVLVEPGYTLLGGGAIDNWTGEGNLLTGSYPLPDGTGWAAEGKDHKKSSPAAITTFAIGIHQ